jgi:hypothetical protein
MFSERAMTAARTEHATPQDLIDCCKLSVPDSTRLVLENMTNSSPRDFDIEDFSDREFSIAAAIYVIWHLINAPEGSRAVVIAGEPARGTQFMYLMQQISRMQAALKSACVWKTPTEMTVGTKTATLVPNLPRMAPELASETALFVVADAGNDDDRFVRMVRALEAEPRGRFLRIW